IMQWFCWHVAAKMSLGFLCLFLVFSTGKDDESCFVSQQEKMFLSLFLHFPASCVRRENKKEKQVAVLATAELPAKSLDLAAINLTELVNGMLSSALRGTKKLFSLLSVTSYSSFAFHKVSVTIYNISNAKNVDPGKFPIHYCYCLNNVTNDLTDFTALLVDIIGNSTSYLTEIFKSTSILSVRQSNDSDCIYICVMTGQTGKNLSDFWEILENSPVINYTFSSNTSSDLGKYILGYKRKQQQHFVKLQEEPNKTLDPSAEHVWTFKMCCSLCALGHPCPQCVGALPLTLFAFPATRIPLAQKGEEMSTTRFPPWPETVGAKGSGFPSPHMGASKPPGTAGFPPTPGRSSVPSPAPQPRPSEYREEEWNLLHPTGCGVWPNVSEVEIGSPFRETHSGSLVSSLFYCRSAKINCRQPMCSFSSFSFSEKLSLAPHRCFCHLGLPSYFAPNLVSRPMEKQYRATSLGCPQAILRDSRVTSPPVTLIVQKINPCVMELCRFFQLCLCVGQRRYSRKEAMRYCVEYYSWFVKNASYVCERVKRVTYSHTLKQKCLKNICASV
ncbi:HHLA1 protein, partial [Onychorhynchus coronatus]|nr:HHLA1 protein [Onychorhynchus coronatus]